MISFLTFLREERRTNILGINPVQVRDARELMRQLGRHKKFLSFQQSGKLIRVHGRDGGLVTTFPKGTVGTKTALTALSAIQSHLLDNEPDWTPHRNERGGLKSTVRRGSPGSIQDYRPEAKPEPETTSVSVRPVDRSKLRTLQGIVGNKGMKTKRRERIQRAIEKLKSRT